MRIEHDPLVVENVRKRIAGFQLIADLEVRAGERLGISGPSGSGKTSLLKLVSGLLAPDSGRILLGSHDLSSLPPERRQIGCVFQDALLFPTLTVLENAVFGLRVRKVDRKAREAEGRRWLERVGLLDRAGSDVRELSGGEKQRVAFVRAIAWKPKALLLDEPFSAVDARTRSSLQSALLDLHALWPVPLLIVSHDEAELGALANVRCHIAFDDDAGSIRRIIRKS